MNRVREVLRANGIPDRDVATSRLDLASTWNYGTERKFLGYECTAAFAIALRELDKLEELLIAVVDAGANQVDGVDFDVTAKPTLRAQARTAAVIAAREKATLYADAAGVRLGPVIHIKDVDSDALENQGGGHARGGGDGSGSGDLSPGKIAVKAGALIGFALDPS